jgi:hypothetical protein
MSLLSDPTMGMERLAREVLKILVAELNTELDAQETAWAALDQELATVLGIELAPTELEHVESPNFVLGHRPSFIEAPIDRYPNVAVMSYMTRPGGDQSMDEFFGLSTTIAIEVMCKAGPYEREDQSGDGEELVNRRTQRTVEAIFRVLTRNKTLHGLADQITTAPVVGISEVEERQDDISGRGGFFFWQAGRIELTVTRLARAF